MSTLHALHERKHHTTGGATPSTALAGEPQRNHNTPWETISERTKKPYVQNSRAIIKLHCIYRASIYRLLYECGFINRINHVLNFKQIGKINYYDNYILVQFQTTGNFVRKQAVIQKGRHIQTQTDRQTWLVATVEGSKQHQLALSSHSQYSG